MEENKQNEVVSEALRQLLEPAQFERIMNYLETVQNHKHERHTVNASTETRWYWIDFAKIALCLSAVIGLSVFSKLDGCAVSTLLGSIIGYALSTITQGSSAD